MKPKKLPNVKTTPEFRKFCQAMIRAGYSPEGARSHMAIASRILHHRLGPTDYKGARSQARRAIHLFATWKETGEVKRPRRNISKKVLGNTLKVWA